MKPALLRAWLAIVLGHPIKMLFIIHIALYLATLAAIKKIIQKQGKNTSPPQLQPAD